MENYPRDLNIIYKDIKTIIELHGISKPLLVLDLVFQYYQTTNRDLLMEMFSHKFVSLEAFLVNSEYFRLFMKNGETFVYLNPEKLDRESQPMQKSKKFLRGKRVQKRNYFSQKPNKVVPDSRTYQEQNIHDIIEIDASPEEDAADLLLAKKRKKSAKSKAKRLRAKQRKRSNGGYNGNTQNPNTMMSSYHTPAFSTISQIYTHPIEQSAAVHVSAPQIHIPTQMSEPMVNRRPQFKKKRPRRYLPFQQIDGPLGLDFRSNHVGFQDLSAFQRRQDEWYGFTFNIWPICRRCYNYHVPCGACPGPFY